MTSPHWPLTGLRLRTSRLELRWPTLGDLDDLAAWQAHRTVPVEIRGLEPCLPHFGLAA